VVVVLHRRAHPPAWGNLPGQRAASEVRSSFDGPVGAYVHIPFCEALCPFCPYNKVTADDALARRYFDALRCELDWYGTQHRRSGRSTFTSLYVGGGTPTLYPDELADVVDRIPSSGERAVEVLPTHATPKRLDALANIGFTAVSIGAQSFHDAVLRRLCRPHDAATSLAAVENARGGFDCVDVDLIVDVAWEDDETMAGAFLDDVRTCFDLGVDQVSTYPLMRFGYTPFGATRHDRRREHAVLGRVTDLAHERGYERRSVWTFNRSGAPSYTSITRRRFLGMGAGSSSFAGRDFYVNHFGVVAYCESVEHDRLPVARWLHLGGVAGATYDTFWQAYAGGVDVPALVASYGSAVTALLRAGLTPLGAAGLLESTPGGYRLTPRGFDAYHDLERMVTYRLIEPLWAEMLAEHASDPGGCTTSGRARTGWAWPVVRWMFEQQLSTPRQASREAAPTSRRSAPPSRTAPRPGRRPGSPPPRSGAARRRARCSGAAPGSPTTALPAGPVRLPPRR
jgi:oxygen-independent coproporphyrinogen-3 oxidase